MRGCSLPVLRRRLIAVAALVMVLGGLAATALGMTVANALLRPELDATGATVANGLARDLVHAYALGYPLLGDTLYSATRWGFRWKAISAWTPICAASSRMRPASAP